MIQLHNKQFVPFISSQEIDFALATMASQVEADFADEIPVFVGVLNGSFMVVSDFMKHYKKPCEVSFIKLTSYEGTTSTNKVKQLIGLNQDLTGRTIIVIEDIVDTGNTVTELKELFKKQNVKHFKIATFSFTVLLCDYSYFKIFYCRNINSFLSQFVLIVKHKSYLNYLKLLEEK